MTAGQVTVTETATDFYWSGDSNGTNLIGEEKGSEDPIGEEKDGDDPIGKEKDTDLAVTETAVTNEPTQLNQSTPEDAGDTRAAQRRQAYLRAVHHANIQFEQSPDKDSMHALLQDVVLKHPLLSRAFFRTFAFHRLEKLTLLLSRCKCRHVIIRSRRWLGVRGWR